MSDAQVWEQLKLRKIVSGVRPDGEDDKVQTLWYVRVLQGFAGWVAALFLIGFLGLGVVGLFEYNAALMLLGVIINISTYVFFKNKSDSDFFEQLVLAFSLTGQFLFAFGLFAVFDFRSRHWIFVIGLYQLVLMWLVNHYLHRFLSTCFAVLALFWSFDVLIYSGLGSAIVAALFVWIWLNKTAWHSVQDFYEPIGYALALSLLFLNVQSQLWLSPFWFQSGQLSWLMQNANWISAVLNSAVLLYFIYRVTREQRIGLASTTGRLIILAAVMMLFSAMPIIGLSSALLVLLVGFARQNKVLMILGGLALLGFVCWYYYSLQITLLHKSMILMAIGVVLLLGALLLKYSMALNKENKSEAISESEKVGLTAWQKIVAVLTLVLGLVGVNHSIMQKEQVLADGQSVLLELAPLDPRSIMQGDFMRLRFAMAQEIRANLPVSSLPGRQENHDGYVWVKPNENGVGEFHALTEADQNLLQSNESADDSLLKLQYRIRNNRVQFATNAFFFQEGDAALFDQARYGLFKVADDGELLLTAMYDGEYELLGENRMD